MDNAKIENYLTAIELDILAEFLKRIIFEDAYRLAGDETEHEARKTKAYNYLSAITKLQKMLADMGYNPR
jgi:hypothetical protein